MLTFPEIEPVAFKLFGLSVHWYGISYLFGFLGAYWLAIKRSSKLELPWTVPQISDILFYIALGTILGGRIGYLLFYDVALIFDEPWQLIAFWERGRSFHGGLIGVILALFYYSKISKRSFLQVTDFIAPTIPIGLGFGRLGNFINGELWGKVTNLPWAMVFPDAGPMPRHPSQLYEFLLEGVALLVVLLLYDNSKRNKGAVSGMFLLMYGIFRFVVEFMREPDAFLGYVALNWMTMGQVLCIPMIIVGAYLLCIYSKFLNNRNLCINI